MRRRAFAIAVAIAVTAPVLPGQTRGWVDLSGHNASAVDVAPGVHLEVLDGNHYLFFTNEAEVVRQVRDFLGTLTSGQQ